MEPAWTGLSHCCCNPIQFIVDSVRISEFVWKFHRGCSDKCTRQWSCMVLQWCLRTARVRVAFTFPCQQQTSSPDHPGISRFPCTDLGTKRQSGWHWEAGVCTNLQTSLGSNGLCLGTETHQMDQFCWYLLVWYSAPFSLVRSPSLLVRRSSWWIAPASQLVISECSCNSKALTWAGIGCLIKGTLLGHCGPWVQQPRGNKLVSSFASSSFIHSVSYFSMPHGWSNGEADGLCMALLIHGGQSIAAGMHGHVFAGHSVAILRDLWSKHSDIGSGWLVFCNDNWAWNTNNPPSSHRKLRKLMLPSGEPPSPIFNASLLEPESPVLYSKCGSMGQKSLLQLQPHRATENVLSPVQSCSVRV